MLLEKKETRSGNKVPDETLNTPEGHLLQITSEDNVMEDEESQLEKIINLLTKIVGMMELSDEPKPIDFRTSVEVWPNIKPAEMVPSKTPGIEGSIHQEHPKWPAKLEHDCPRCLSKKISVTTESRLRDNKGRTVHYDCEVCSYKAKLEESW